MKTPRALLLLLVTSVLGVVLAPGSSAEARAPGAGQDVCAYSERLADPAGDEAAAESGLPVLDAETETRIIVQQPESSATQASATPLVDGDSPTLAFAAAALAAPAFAAITLVAARGGRRSW